MTALLRHAAEEASEFIQAAMKLAREDWGANQITDEAADTVAFVLLLIERGVIKNARFDKRVAKKLKKMRRKYG
jgi:NTP pyrophosphatase (non-canonical NTP hydrolase)